jgi:hypothetical protein
MLKFWQQYQDFFKEPLLDYSSGHFPVNTVGKIKHILFSTLQIVTRQGLSVIFIEFGICN